MIEEALLLQYGAEVRQLKKNELIFEVGHYPGFYYQIKEGKVKNEQFYRRW